MLDPETWRRCSALLDEALDLEPAARDAWLDALRREQPDVADSLERLLAHERRDAGPVLLSDATGARRGYEHALSATLDEPERDAASVGQTFGPWQLVRKLGSGGMGEVWLARRADALYRGEAAIKLLSAHGDMRRLKGRFARERELLARLAHPGIARLLDAGVAGDQPYLVLEHVDGESLLAHAHRAVPQLAGRLRLVLAVARAVEYAHSRLIVHRDLKPSNVMVTPAGEPKLLDFGIAALLENEDEGDGLTRLYGAGLTLDYAAPEQITGDAAAGVGCDIYALGVMLFELIAGQRPLRGERPGRTAFEHAVLHQDAPRLSRALAAELPADAPTGARPHDAARVNGDLDAIVAKALRKQPADRYPTMSAFIADLENWLAHRPVSAGRDDAAYRARLWLRRNRLAAGLTFAVLLSLLAGLGVSLWQWQRALHAAHKAETVQGFLVSLFEAPNNWNNDGAEPSLRKIVEGGAQRVEHELAGQPDVQLALNEVLLSTYQGLGDYAAAEAIARRALELSERVDGRDSESRARILNALANNIYDAGRYDEAAALFEESLRILRLRHGDASLEVADLLNDLAAVEAARGRLQESVRLRREALKRFEADPEAQPVDVERIRSDLGLALDRAGAWQEAEAVYRRGMDRTADERGTLRHSSYPHNLGSLLVRVGRYDEAERLLQEAIDIRRRDAATHPYLGLSLRNYAQLLDETGRTDQARTAIDEALAILRQRYAADSSTVAMTELRQALILAHAGDPAAAETLARAARQHIDTDTPLDRARADRTLGEILMLRGKRREAQAELRAAIDVFDRLQGPAHPEAALALGLLGLSERGIDDLAARTHLQSAIERLQPQLDPAQATLLRLRRALDERRDT